VTGTFPAVGVDGERSPSPHPSSRDTVCVCDRATHLTSPTDHHAAASPSSTRGWATTRGHRRAHNDDAAWASAAVCVVADGFGGHPGGGDAARLAVDLIGRRFSGCAASADELVDVVLAADAAVRALPATGPAPPSATVVGVARCSLGDDVLPVVFHVGDARCYRLAGGRLELLTIDHVSAPGGGPSGISRALGWGLPAPPVLTVLDAEPCRLLLCSDGVSDQVPMRALGRLLAAAAAPSSTAARLIDVVLAGPARDNATALVVDVRVDVRVDGADGGAGQPLDSASPTGHDVDPHPSGAGR
jgi:serine/threonine protein phosphatase PrpC